MGRLRKAGLIALAVAAAGSLVALFGQEPPVFRSNVRLVRLLVTVKDRNGDLVGNLAKTDFTIKDNDVPQEIATFDRYTGSRFRSLC